MNSGASGHGPGSPVLGDGEPLTQDELGGFSKKAFIKTSRRRGSGVKSKSLAPNFPGAPKNICPTPFRGGGEFKKVLERFPLGAKKGVGVNFFPRGFSGGGRYFFPGGGPIFSRSIFFFWGPPTGEKKAFFFLKFFFSGGVWCGPPPPGGVFSHFFVRALVGRKNPPPLYYFGWCGVGGKTLSFLFAPEIKKK